MLEKKGTWFPIRKVFKHNWKCEAITIKVENKVISIILAQEIVFILPCNKV